MTLYTDKHKEVVAKEEPVTKDHLVRHVHVFLPNGLQDVTPQDTALLGMGVCSRPSDIALIFAIGPGGNGGPGGPGAIGGPGGSGGIIQVATAPEDAHLLMCVSQAEAPERLVSGGNGGAPGVHVMSLLSWQR